MASTNINIRMDTDLKMQFEAFCADMGMTMTTAFNVFAKKAVREYRIPFEISGEVPNAVTRKAIEDAENGIGMEEVISILAEQKPLPEIYRDHNLSGDYIGCRECHITPDWLLIYEIKNNELVLCLTRTGTHSDLF